MVVLSYREAACFQFRSKRIRMSDQSAFLSFCSANPPLLSPPQKMQRNVPTGARLWGEYASKLLWSIPVRFLRGLCWSLGVFKQNDVVGTTLHDPLIHFHIPQVPLALTTASKVHMSDISTPWERPRRHESSGGIILYNTVRSSARCVHMACSS